MDGAKKVKKNIHNIEKPNVMLIMTDQHRLSAVGAYGETVCQTPNIDRLAQDSVLFQNAYTVCPVCSPARASIMTGLYPHAHGICANVHNLGCSIHELSDSTKLLSRQLQQARYSIGYSGKWHLGTDLTETFGSPNIPSVPSTVGFEGQNFPGHGSGGFYYPEYKEYLKHNSYEHKLINCDNTTFQCQSMGELAGPIESTVPYFLTENTISMIDNFSQRDKPFFIWHNFWGPHEPYYVTQEFLELYNDVKIPEWPNYRWPSASIPGPHQIKIHPNQSQLAWDDWSKALRHYYAFTTMIDSQIGRIVSHLEKTGLLDNTIIIFISDHGETLGSHGGLVDKGFHHFEEIQRIPMIFRFPDRFNFRSTNKNLVSLIDIYPTILELAGSHKQNNTIHGQSLLPIIKDAQKKLRESLVVEFEGLSGSSITLRTIRYENFKYGYSCGFNDEFYDLAKDPYETTNLINHPTYSDSVKYLQEMLACWMAEMNDTAGGDPRIGPNIRL